MRKYLKYLLVVFITVSFSLIQMAWANPPKEPDVRQRIAMYSKPAVVRVVANCSGSFQREKTGKYYLYVDGGHGSGFFINPDGYIATRAIPQSESECKERLFKRFVADLAQDGGDAVAEKMTGDSIQNIDYSHSVLLPSQKEPLEFDVKRASAPLEAVCKRM